MLNRRRIGWLLLLMMSAASLEGRAAWAAESARAPDSRTPAAKPQGPLRRFAVYLRKGESPAKTMEMIRAHDLDVAGVRRDSTGTRIELIATDGEFLRLRGDRAARTLKMRRLPALSRLDSQYLNLQRMEQQLKDVVARYPNLARLEEIGKSVEGRPLWVLRLTSPKGDPASKPAVAFDYGIHAREIVPPSAALDVVSRLTAGYGSDPRITRWLDSMEVAVIPTMNPDGLQRVWTNNRMQRKNANEVDLNRNFDFDWCKCNGSSGNPSSQTYRGPRAESEPETRAYARWMEKRQPIAAISNHSYSELVIMPFGCKARKDQVTPFNRAIVTDLAKELIADSGRPYRAGQSWELLYEVDGASDDWSVGKVSSKPIGMTVEWGTSFQPSWSEGQKIFPKHFKAVGNILDRVGGPGVSVEVDSDDRRRTTQLEILRLGRGPASGTSEKPVVERKLTRGRPSIAHQLLTPGRYLVKATRSDGIQTEQKVTVKDSRETVVVRLHR